MATLNSIAYVNSVVWITSLLDKEVGVTRRVVEDLEDLFHRVGMSQFHRYAPQSAAELLQILDDLAGLARDRGLRPIIHFDTHGDKEKGIRIVQTGEFVPWSELIARFRAINSQTGNNLCVVSMACFSLHMVSKASLLEPTPWYIFAAPDEEVVAGFVEETVVPFYERVFVQRDIMQAFADFLEPKLQLIHCEEILFSALKAYLDKGVLGKAGDARRESLLSEAKTLGLTTGRTLRQTRLMIKKQIRADEHLLMRYVKSFLMGKPVSYRMSDIKAAVEKSRR
ncbi:MAG: hypothetical protein EOS21_31415 [Mesorhizobium sp.]|nr:MAG: hypothetical protein EOS21_31415 [Mesorhizobium sp.]